MPRDGAGVYGLPSGYFATPNTTILDTQHNGPLEDIAQALTDSLPRSGVAAMTGALSLVNADPTLANHATRKSYVDATAASAAAAAAAGVVVPTGTVIDYVGAAAPAGYVKANGSTIGSATSGATLRANADTEALYTLLWNTYSNTDLVIQTSLGVPTTRGASAAADFAANKRMPTLDLRGEFVRGLDDGRGVDTGRTLGSAQADMVGPHNHTINDPGHLHTTTSADNTGGGGAFSRGNNNLSGLNTPTATTGITINNNSGTETRPRNIALLKCIKL